MAKRKMLTIMAGAALAVMVYQSAAQAKQPAPIIEVVTLKLKSGVTAAQFDAVDREIQTKYIAKRSGFLSRESAREVDVSCFRLSLDIRAARRATSSAC